MGESQTGRHHLTNLEGRQSVSINAREKPLTAALD